MSVLCNESTSNDLQRWRTVRKCVTCTNYTGKYLCSDTRNKNKANSVHSTTNEFPSFCWLVPSRNFVFMWMFVLISQELKAGMVSGQLLLDFLSQSGPQVVGTDIQALCSKRTMFAEQLGALRLQWFHLHRELESQVWFSATQMQQTTSILRLSYKSSIKTDMCCVF